MSSKPSHPLGRVDFVVVGGVGGVAAGAFAFVSGGVGEGKEKTMLCSSSDIRLPSWASKGILGSYARLAIVQLSHEQSAMSPCIARRRERSRL
jgi:hypothetical protein